MRHHLAATTSARGRPALVADSPSGQAYLADLAWTLAYAEANRTRNTYDRAARVIADALGLEPDLASISDLPTTTTSATRSTAGALGSTARAPSPRRRTSPASSPGSMGTASYHVAGRGHPDALCSSSHGAGRALPRSEARRRSRRGRSRPRWPGCR